MLSSESYQSYFHNAIGFEQYQVEFRSSIESGPDGKYANYSQYLPLNWQRTTRVYKHYQPSEAIINTAASLAHKVYWLMIVEPWCGDVSQSLPVIARVAEASKERIELRLTYRDHNPELMNAHLTNGVSRSIPILIQLDSEFKVLGTWGPRPKEAQVLVEKLKSDPATADNYAEELHRWYAHDKQQAIQTELLALLKK